MSLSNKVAIVTGGGSGLGEATCLLFAKEGATVVIADYDIESARKVEHEITVNGGKAIAIRVDVSNRRTVDNMVAKVHELFGKVDILINNAGITMDSTLAKMSQNQWQNVIDVNLTGAFNCIQAVIPHMIEEGYGRIINTSSVVGTSGGFGQVNYSASKAGLIGMTKSLAKELGKKGITTNAVAPGFIMTPMVKAMPDNIIKMMEDKIPLGHLGEPIDIANAYLYLASDMARYVNGTVLEIDGGILF